MMHVLFNFTHKKHTQSRTLYIQTRHLCNVYLNRRTMTMNLIESMIEKKQQQILLTEIKCYENW